MQSSGPGGPVSSTVWWFTFSNTPDYTYLLIDKFSGCVSIEKPPNFAGHWPSGTGIGPVIIYVFIGGTLINYCGKFVSQSSVQMADFVSVFKPLMEELPNPHTQAPPVFIVL